jgi:hypothetical protein
VHLTDFRASIARVREGPRGNIAVRITSVAPGSAPWTTVGSAGDLLHAAWTALTDNLELAVLSRAGVSEAHKDELPAAMPLADLAPILRPEMDDEDRGILGTVARTDWSHRFLDIAKPDHRTMAAQAAALGAAIFYSFANFCAVAARPERESVVRVNRFKGRPENQVGSVTTTRAHFEALFDWSLVPAELSKARIVELMDSFYALGPLGFRGPAATSIPHHLTSRDAGLRTTQLIAPGHRCLSNELVAEALARSGHRFLFITSANVSSGITGHVEPAHYDIRAIQEDFGKTDGIVLIGHADEAAIRATYPEYLPMSTSILAFHKLGRDPAGRPALFLERHGSLGIEDIRSVLDWAELGLLLEDTAHDRLPMRDAAEGGSSLA